MSIWFTSCDQLAILYANNDEYDQELIFINKSLDHISLSLDDLDWVNWINDLNIRKLDALDNLGRQTESLSFRISYLTQ